MTKLISTKKTANTSIQEQEKPNIETAFQENHSRRRHVGHPRHHKKTHNNGRSPKASDLHHTQQKQTVHGHHAQHRTETTQTRDDHAPTTGTKHGRGKWQQHQKATANKSGGRVSNRRRRKIADLTSKKTNV
jgi:hypothetical protein